jgi:hypothetical protein
MRIIAWAVLQMIKQFDSGFSQIKIKDVFTEKKYNNLE